MPTASAASKSVIQRMPSSMDGRALSSMSVVPRGEPVPRPAVSGIGLPQAVMRGVVSAIADDDPAIGQRLRSRARVSRCRHVG